MQDKWRVATVEELHEVFNYKNGRPKVDGFTQYYYWSSTPYSHNMNGVWIVHFHRGYAYNGNKLSTYCVRCARENKNGTLEWSKPLEKKMTLDEANKYCKMMNDERKWRLPTVDELHEVFDYKNGEPKVDGFIPYRYWSFTTHAYFTDNAWVVYFSDGHTDYHNKSNPIPVRCVRTQDNGELEWYKYSKNGMNWNEANEWCKELNDEANTN